MKLNLAQQSAVRYINGPCLVLAGAGSGKTRVITEKIQYLTSECGLKPERVYAVTFTNKAAREMRARVSQRLGKEAGHQVSISTFHSLGIKILRQDGAKLGYGSGFSLFDEHDCCQLIQELAGGSKLCDKATASTVQHQISRWKNAGLSPEQVEAKRQAEASKLAVELYHRYVLQMKAYQAMDFDDLIGMPLALFQQYPDVLEKWQAQIHYLLVDEYQDTNASQYQLMSLLVKGRQAFTVVGDDDQSIYAWRGALPENLALLKQHFPTLEVIKLEMNYRSTATILNAANHLIGHNPHLFEKRLQTDKGTGERIRVVFAHDDEVEADRIVTEIQSHQFQCRVPFHHYAILYRSNHQAAALEKALRLRKVPYQLSGGQSFFARAEIKDMLAYCRLLANPRDDSAFVRVVNTPRREIGATSLRQLAEFAKSRKMSLLEAGQHVELEAEVSSHAAKRIREFAHWILTLSRQNQSASVADVLNQLISDCSYEAWLESQTKNRVQATKRMERVNELVEWLEGLYQENPNRSFAELIQTVLLLDHQEDDDRQNRVQLMTIHASKGLEFPMVFLCGFEETILPHRNSIDEGQVDEERRIAYVAITRAEQELMISLCKKRQRFGETVACVPSRFLAEIPETLLKIEGKEALSDDEKKQRNRDRMAQLKAQLNLHSE